MSRKTDLDELRALAPLSTLQTQRAQEQDQELDEGLQALINRFMTVKNMTDPYNYILNAYQKLPPATLITEKYPGGPRDLAAWGGAKPSTRIEDRRADLPMYGPWPQLEYEQYGIPDRPPTPPWLDYPEEKQWSGPWTPPEILVGDYPPVPGGSIPALPYPVPSGPSQMPPNLEQWPKDTTDRSGDY